MNLFLKMKFWFFSNSKASGVDFKLTSINDASSPDGYQHLKIFPEGQGLSYDLTGDVTDLTKPLEVMYYIKDRLRNLLIFETTE